MRFMVGLAIALTATLAFSAPVFAREPLLQVCGPPFTGPPFCQPPMGYEQPQMKSAAIGKSGAAKTAAPAPKSAPRSAPSKK